MAALLQPLTLRSVTFRNRIMVSPMCQYSAENGVPTDWHLVHLGARAAGGAGLVMAEATAVEPRGRISPDDTGLWNAAQVAAWAPIAGFITGSGAVPGVQLAHAGRKAGTARPWEGGRPLPAAGVGWQVVGSTALPFTPDHQRPHALTAAELQGIAGAFADAAARAGGRLPRGRDPRRARLPDPLLPLATGQHMGRRVRSRLAPPAAPDRGRGPQGVDGGTAPLRPALRHRLDAWRHRRRAHGGDRPPPQGPRR